MRTGYFGGGYWSNGYFGVDGPFDGVVLYPSNSNSAVAYIPIGDLENPPVNATDNWLKGPFSLYITINSVLKKLPDSILGSLQANDMVYRWTYDVYTGKFLYRQDLKSPEILVSSMTEAMARRA